MADDKNATGSGMAELEVVEAVLVTGARRPGTQYPQLLFPDVLQRARADGSFTDLPVRYAIQGFEDLRLVRAQAKQIAADDGIDPEADQLVFDNLEQTCLLWRALREANAPYEPLALDPRDLERRLPEATLAQAKGQYEHWRRKVDPLPDDIDENGMVLLAAMITEKRDIRPLLGYGGRSQEKFILFMATRLLQSLAQQSSQQPSEPSTPAP